MTFPKDILHESSDFNSKMQLAAKITLLNLLLIIIHQFIAHL